MTDDLHWRSLREIDLECGQPNGSAFRAFKKLQENFTESYDYVVLHHQDDAKVIETLRAAGRIYRSSVNIILLAPTAAQRIQEELNGGRATPVLQRQ